MKKFTILSLIFLVIFLNINIEASDLLGGEFVFKGKYYNDENQHPELLGYLDLELNKSGWNTGFYVDVNAETNLNSDYIDFKFKEFYFDYYGYNYDLRLGKQTITWGAANEFNPTNNLNPANINDPMGDNKPIVMARANYYLGNKYKCSLVLIPYHEPVIDRVQYNNIEIMATPIEDKLENTEYAFKISGKGVQGFDFSLSYYRGFEDLPSIKVKPTSQGPVPDEVYYRPVQIYGLDLATSYKGIGIWTEGAYFVPEMGKEYIKFVVGSDYKFPGNLYLEGQLIYQENQMSIEDRLFQGTLEYPFARIHTLRLGSVYNVDTEGYMLKPEIKFSLDDATNLTLGYQYSEGIVLQGRTIENRDTLNIELSYSF